MAQIDVKELAAEVVALMRDSGHALWIDPKIHAEQHQFLSELIVERRAREARRKRIEEMVAGTVVLSLIFGVIGLIGAGAIDWLKTIIKMAAKTNGG